MGSVGDVVRARRPSAGAAWPTASSWGLILLGTALGWWIVLGQAGGNGPGTMGLNLAGFLGFWVAMVAGMMLPSVLPTARAYADGIGRQEGNAPRAVLRAGMLTAGYLLAWTLSGVPVYGLARLAGTIASGWGSAARWIAAVAVLLCAVYQLAPLKDCCLTKCRSTFAFLVEFAEFHGKTRDLRAGLHHGIYCLGCCAGLMLLLIPLGLMNLGWMVALALVITAEKTWRHGPGVGRLIGIALVVYALMIPIFPSLAPGLVSTAGIRGPTMSSMHMN